MSLVIKSKDIDYSKIVDFLKNGEIGVYPTDTAYALGCDATNKKAVEKIFCAKSRLESKTLPVIVGSFDMALEWFVFDSKALMLAKEFWPGPLSMVLPVKKNLLSFGVSEKGFSCVRVPKNEIACKLSIELKAPLVSTSANLSGGETCYSVESVIKSLGANTDMLSFFIDQEDLPRLGVSTIVKLCDNKVKIIREGIIPGSKFL